MKYRPIACDFHDRLLAHATLRRTVEVVYRTAEEPTPRVTHDRIVDVYTRRGEEFLRLGAGAVIRLDRLLGVDGVAPDGAACRLLDAQVGVDAPLADVLPDVEPEGGEEVEQQGGAQGEAG